ncbi:MAG: DUF167 domain-containing protein [Halioglobus sp.]|jgi:uncharacterized protein (TIGR00251 family)
MPQPGPARIALKVVPGASSNGVAGWLGESLKIRVTAPAESGKANAAVIKLLAALLGVPRQSVSIAAGGSSPRKIVEISVLSEAEVRKRLQKATQRRSATGSP